MNRPLIKMTMMICIFFLIVIIAVYRWLHPAEDSPEAHDGLLDARGWSFEDGGVLQLRGQWEFYKGKLLTPEDFRNNPQLASERTLVNVPDNWKGVVSAGGKDGYGAGTYRLVVKLDEAGLYSIRAKKVRMASHFFINGTDLGGNGRPTLTAAGFVASNLPFLGTENISDGTAEIIVQMASFNFIEGGLVQIPEFGPYALIAKRIDLSRLADMVQLTTMLVFALYYGGMFNHWRKERHLGYFGLFCLSTGVFFSIDNEILLAGIIPSLSFAMLQKTVFVTVYLTFIFFTLYVYHYVGEPDNRVFLWLRRVAYLYISIVIVMPNDYLSSTLIVNVLLEGICFVCAFYALYRSRSRGVPGTGYLAIGVFFLIVTWVFGQFRYELGMDNPFYMIVSPILLVFSQAFLMSNRMQQAFTRNEKLSSQLMIYDRQKDEFLAKTSHELRTPLHGIINLSQLLLDEGEEGLAPRHRDNIRLMNLVGRRLAGLVGDIMDMSLIKHGQLHIRTSVADIRVSVSFVLETLSISPVNKQVVFVNELPRRLPLVLADENRLKQILHNLLENALKFTERGVVKIYAAERNGELAVTVEDTGPGIPRKLQEIIFQPFEHYGESGTRGQEGIGLGLSITKQLVELMGGGLSLDSEPGHGSRFTFTLPLAGGEAAAASEFDPPPLFRSAMSAAGYPEDGTPAEFKILLVDDEPSNLKILIDAVTALGCDYTAVQSGEEAARLARGPAKPDLVLLDLMMPGLSGLEVCAQIRALHSLAELPILMLTASGRHDDKIASLAAGANDILQKPFELAELKARVQSLLAMKRSSEDAVRREMDFLQAQITPHFLYNSFNVLVGLSYKDSNKLRETIQHLTTYLRAKFTFTPGSESVPLERELELVRAYLAIEQLRFGNRLNVRYSIEESLNCMIPPLTLQPIVENAVRHGIGQKPSGGTVDIRAFRENEGVTIIVEDDGIGMDEETVAKLVAGRSSGVGTGNVSRRLKILYDRKLDIRSERDQGTQVVIRIPEEVPYA